MNKRHEHKQHQCEHEHMAYCRRCDVAYCEDCNREWKKPEPIRYSYTLPYKSFEPDRWYPVSPVWADQSTIWYGSTLVYNAHNHS